jgi:hypothetical protein
MNMLSPPVSSDLWLAQVFASQAARDGGVVRRKVRDVEMIVGRGVFEAAIRHRGFHLVENGGQFVIFCNDAPIRVVL